MLGSAPETRGSIAAVVEAYRTHGLFRRWPIDYIATHGDGLPRERVRLLIKAVRQFAERLLSGARPAVHVHTAARGNFWRDVPFMAAALAARCPLLLQIHGSGFERFYDRCDSLSRATIGFFLERAACVVVASESRRAWVRSISRKANVVCVPNPVDIGEIAARPLADGERPNLILFLGKLEAAKGIFDLLEAVAALRPGAPDVRLVCAGDGDRIAVARYAERLGIAEAVKFTGWVGPSGKRALLENAAVFALPSYDETLPMSVLEAMSAGVPVVASPVGGIAEVVLDGTTGFLVAPGDKQNLARLLARLLSDRALAERVGAAGRESARLRFAPERALPRLEELYRSLGLSEEQRGSQDPARPRQPELKKAA